MSVGGGSEDGEGRYILITGGPDIGYPPPSLGRNKSLDRQALFSAKN